MCDRRENTKKTIQCYLFNTKKKKKKKEEEAGEEERKKEERKRKKRRRRKREEGGGESETQRHRQTDRERNCCFYQWDPKVRNVTSKSNETSRLSDHSNQTPNTQVCVLTVPTCASLCCEKDHTGGYGTPIVHTHTQLCRSQNTATNTPCYMLEDSHRETRW